MDDSEKTRMGIAAFGAMGAAVSLSLQKKERGAWNRIGKGVTSFIAGICSAVLVAPLAAPPLDNMLQLSGSSTQFLLGFLFGVTGYELWKVVYYRASKLLSSFIDKKERDILGTGSGGLEKEDKTEEV